MEGGERTLGDRSTHGLLDYIVAYASHQSRMPSHTTLTLMTSTLRNYLTCLYLVTYSLVVTSHEDYKI